MRRLTALAVAVLVAAPLAAAAAELVMFEEDGCPWCIRWNEEIGGSYARTPEGRLAPLRRVDITQPTPPDLELTMEPRYTPTFVLVEEGREIGRIEGYPGSDFFWPLLEKLLDKLPEAAR